MQLIHGCDNVMLEMFSSTDLSAHILISVSGFLFYILIERVINIDDTGGVSAQADVLSQPGSDIPLPLPPD